MELFSTQEISEILTRLKTSETMGLAAEEVMQRLAEYGYNQLDAKRKKSFS